MRVQPEIPGLLASRNADGGWPYRPGGDSWIEPTAYAVLALAACGHSLESAARSLDWLRAAQRNDGGWSPQPGVLQSTWVTAVVALLGPRLLGSAPYRRGIAWLLAATGEESQPLTRFRNWLAGQTPPLERRFPGWPWYPGTSAWVVPTALCILALRKALRDQPSPAIASRLELGDAFLLNSACRDGGWNYGCPRALGHEAPSYPETTGVALLAASENQSHRVRQACALAQSQLRVCRSSEGQSWLRLGLLAHAQLPPVAPPQAFPHRTTQGAALALLASAAEQGRNIFLE